MTKIENIQKFAEMLGAPNGTAWARVVPVNKSKTWKGGGTCEWLSYDVQMVYICDGQLREISWDYYKGKINTAPIAFHTDDLDYIAEFVKTNREGVFDAFDKFFFDSREFVCASANEVESSRLEWRERNQDSLNFINP